MAQGAPARTKVRGGRGANTAPSGAGESSRAKPKTDRIASSSAPTSGEATGHTATPDRARIVAVSSGKGGVGKTWVAVQLACLLAQLGEKVVLVDADIGFANVDVHLGLNARLGVDDVVTGRKKLPEALTFFERGGIHVLAGRSGTGTAALTENRIRALLDGLKALSGQHQRIVVDLGAGIDSASAALAALADTCLVVINGDPSSLTDAYAFIKYLQRNKPSCRFEVVVNGVAEEEEGRKAFERLRQVCKRFIATTVSLRGIVRRDEEVSRSIRKQTPLAVLNPSAPSVQDMRAVARFLAEGRGLAEL